MNSPPPPPAVQGPVLPAGAPSRYRPYSWPAWIAFLYAGAVLPVICFLLTIQESPDAADWQSGQLQDYVSFLLSGQTTFVFYPFLTYSIISFLLALWNPPTFSQYAWVRLGLYSGVVLAVHFSIVQGMVLFSVDDWWSPRWLTIAFSGTVVVVAPWLTWLAIDLVWRRVPLVRRWRENIWNWLRSFRLTGRVLAWCAVAATVLLVLTNILLLSFDWPGRFVENSLEATLGVGFFLSLCCAPYWTLAVYVALSIRAVRVCGQPKRVSLLRFLAAFTWLGAYLAAWRFSVTRTLELYAALPKEHPGGCYVATAAARGHRPIVGSRIIHTTGGCTLYVNRQLAYFKCAELACQTLAPSVHQRLRKAYDHAGPRLARRICHPLTADVAYLSLKPCEWLVRILLHPLVPRLNAVVDGLYGEVE